MIQNAPRDGLRTSGTTCGVDSSLGVGYESLMRGRSLAHWTWRYDCLIRHLVKLGRSRSSLPRQAPRDEVSTEIEAVAEVSARRPRAARVSRRLPSEAFRCVHGSHSRFAVALDLADTEATADKLVQTDATGDDVRAPHSGEATASRHSASIRSDPSRLHRIVDQSDASEVRHLQPIPRSRALARPRTAIPSPAQR